MHVTGFQLPHLVGDNPLGPFKATTIAAPPTHFNPVRAISQQSLSAPSQCLQSLTRVRLVAACLSLRASRFPHSRRSFVKVFAACRMTARRRGSTSSTQTAAPFGSACSSSSGTAERQPGARSGGSSATAPRAALPGEHGRLRTTCTPQAEL